MHVLDLMFLLLVMLLRRGYGCGYSISIWSCPLVTVRALACMPTWFRQVVNNEAKSRFGGVSESLTPISVSCSAMDVKLALIY